MVVWRQSHLHVTPSFSKQQQQKWLCGCKRTIEMKLCRLISLSIKQEKISQVPSSSETKPFSFRPTKNYYRTEARYKAVQQGPRDHNCGPFCNSRHGWPLPSVLQQTLASFQADKMSFCFIVFSFMGNMPQILYQSYFTLVDKRIQYRFCSLFLPFQ